jgi:hypothetical protein
MEIVLGIPMQKSGGKIFWNQQLGMSIFLN